MKTIKYFVLLLAISASMSSCFVRGHRGDDHGHDHDMHHDDHH